MPTTSSTSSTSSTPSSAAAQLLAQAWHSGCQLAELPAAVRPASLDQGYDVQDAFMAAQHSPIAGWKLGLASPAAIRATGAARGLIGQMPANRCHAPGARVRLSSASPVTVEFEIALVLGQDVSPGQAPAQPMDAVSAVHVAYEIIQSRFVNRKIVGYPSFVGDNVGFAAFVLGEAIRPEDIPAVIADTTVSVASQLRASAMTGDDLADPAFSLAQLFDHARERGVTLRAGQIVTTGSITQPFDAELGQPVELTANYLGRALTATLEAPAR